MSEHFTHIAVFEDSARLFLNSPEICNPFKTSIKNQYDSGMIGSASRGNHLFSVPILEKLKQNWDEIKNNSEAQIKMAAAIGWMTHRGSDRQMKPVLKKNDQHSDPRYDGYISSIYHDANSFDKVYGNGNTPSRSKNEVMSPATFDYNMQSHPGAKAVQIESAEPLFSWMWQKDLMSMHLFCEQEKDFEKWVDTLVTRWPKFSENFQDYEMAHNDPDPFLEKKYYETDNLYDDHDDIIMYSRSIQKGETPTTDLQTVLKKAESQSEYAQALRRSYVYVKALSDFFMGKIDKTTTYDNVEISEKNRY